MSSLAGQPAGRLEYAASYDPTTGARLSESLTLAASGQVVITGLGTFTVSGGAEIVNRQLDALTLHLGTSVTLGALTVAADSVDLLYTRQDAAAGGASTVRLTLAGGHVAVVGLGSLDVSGGTLLTNGALTSLRLDVATALTLGGVAISGGATLTYTAADSSLTLAVQDGSAAITGLGAITVSGQAALSNGALDALTLAVTGTLAVAGTTFDADASLAYTRVDAATGGPTLKLALTNATATVAGLGTLGVAGAMVIEGGALASFDLAVTSDATLAGVTLSGGLGLSYTAATQTLSFSVNNASATVAGLGSLHLSGSAVVQSGSLSTLSLTIGGDVTLGTVTLSGDMELAYAAAAGSLTFSVSDATIAVAGLGTLSVSGSSQLAGGRLTQLSLAVGAGVSFEGLALSGALSLDYAASYDAGGAVTSRSLSLAVADATLMVPGAEAHLAGGIAIDNGAVTCADLGPATLDLSGVSFEATARYVAAGQTCGHLVDPAPTAAFLGSFSASVAVAGQNVTVRGSADISGGAIQEIVLATTVDLSGVPGLSSVAVAGRYAGGTLCVEGAVQSSLQVPLGVVVKGITAGFCFGGPVVGSVDVKVLVEAPNAVGEPVDILATAGFDGAATALSASVCLAAADAAGAACCAGVGACPATTWHPFSGQLPGLPSAWANLGINVLQGSISIGTGGLDVEAQGLFDASAMPPILPGLSLKSLQVAMSASVGSATAVAAGIRGVFAVPLGEEPVDVTVEGLFEVGGGAGLALSLKGSIGDPASGVSADVEPLRQAIGEDTFEISYFSVEVAAGSAGVSFDIAGGANVSLPPPLSIGPLGVQLAGGGSLGGRSGFYLTGGICGLSLPADLLPEGFDPIMLGQPSPCATPIVSVGLASRAYPEIALAPNTPLKRGLTIAATIAPPSGVLEPLGLDPQQLKEILGLAGDPTIVVELGVDTSGVRLKGALNIPWQVIRPDWNVPGVRLLQLNELAFQVDINSKPSLSFFGSVLFQPSHCLPDYAAAFAPDASPFKAFDPSLITCLDLPAPFKAIPQQRPLTGTARFKYVPPKTFGGEISLNGMWYEPFWAPNVGIANPGLTAEVRLQTGPYGIQIPIPQSLGVNGDVFWKRPYYDDAGGEPTYPVSCNSDAQCTGYGNCSGGACPAKCSDGPDAGTDPDTCSYAWPYTCSDPNKPANAPCIETLYQPADVPASLASQGMTLFLDVVPSPSGLLGLPLPTLIVRREVNNLNTLDLIPALDEMKDGTRNLLRWAEERVPGLSPELSPLPPCVDLDGDGQLDKSLSCLLPATPLPNVLQASPVQIQIDRARLYFSTHEKELFGVTFSPGVRADLDAKLTALPAATCDVNAPCEGGLTCDNGTCKRVVFLSGALGSEGVSLEGRLSPVSLLNAVTVKGDPFTKYADTSAGYLQTGGDEKLAAVPGTIETWFKHNSVYAGVWYSLMRQVDPGNHGYELSVGNPAPYCVTHYGSCDTGQCAQWACEGGPGAPAGADLACGGGEVIGKCSACAPDSEEPCDVPCSTDEECVGATGVAGSTCVGYAPPSRDGLLLSTAKSDADFDIERILSDAATTCPQSGDVGACAAAALSAQVEQLAGAPLSSTCGSCLAGFVTCEQRANIRLGVINFAVASPRVVTSARPVVPKDRWSHVAAVFDDATGGIALYVNGEVVDTVDTGGRPDCDAVCACDTVCTGDASAVSCAGCAADACPSCGSPGGAVTAVHDACGTCQSALATWRAAAEGAGNWPILGAGATMRIAEGIPAVDDVRIWSVERTPEQIASQKSVLPQDGTPEKLGDCSNVGPGACADGGAECDADFDCDTGLCAGAVPRGTCRADADCGAGATCGGYVPPTQRYAFDAGLIARYEFDYDNYKSSLKRAWNTRYQGDPDGLDCEETPFAPPSGGCGLIGEPCQDYDFTNPHKIHASYIGGAHWVSSVDDPGAGMADDLVFKLNVPFGSGIISEGGLWIRGGVAVNFPDDVIPLPDELANGGFRAEVALAGTSEAKGSLYTKSFDFLKLGSCSATTQACRTSAECHDPYFHLDALAYCRDDGFCTDGPCLGRLTLSGYGPNGIDDGIDDGFYVRTNLHAKPLPTLSGGARTSLETFAAPRTDLSFMSYELQCPPGQACNAMADYRLSIAGGLDLTLPLPFAFDGAGQPTKLMQICGNAAAYKPGKGDTLPAWITATSSFCPDPGRDASFGMFVDGSISALSQTLSGSALLTSCGFKARSAIDLDALNIGGLRMPPIGSLSTEVSARFVPFRMCASGYMDLNIDLPEGAGAKLLQIDAEAVADTCVGDPAKISGTDSGNFLRILTGSPDGTPAPATVSFLSLTHGASLFQLVGDVDICVGDGDRIGMAGVRACTSDRLHVCGDISLLGGAISVADACLDVTAPEGDVTFSLRASAGVNLGSIVPSSVTELFIEECARGQVAEWDAGQGKVVCVAAADPNFKMPAPMVRLRLQSNLTFIGGSFGNVDVNLSANFSPDGLSFAGTARYTSGTSTALGFDYWAPDFCDIHVTLVIPEGGAPYLDASAPQCSPYCLVDANCVDEGATCRFGRCSVCGDGLCAFGENSNNCADDCGAPAGDACTMDADCASANCWTEAEQQEILVSDSVAPGQGVCLACDPNDPATCPVGQYCDGFQLLECRDKAGYGVACGWNEVCQSGMCQFDAFWGGPRCADCTSDAHCGVGEWCDTYPALFPTAPDYKCHGLAATGEKCGFTGSDLHCQPGNFCDLDGTCHAQADNAYVCARDAVCQSDHCCQNDLASPPGLGICHECCAKADCGAGEGCYGWECRKGEDGEQCVEDAECGSNNCVFVLGVGYCTTPASNGTACAA
ncbi:MAG: hypothetical protein CVU56_28915, partial [Deltaproteobacteria bacterium HGW-Deltaproteobacteria-14]